MEKLKILPSTMRENRRYLLLKADSKKVEKALMKFVGELGWAKANPIFVPADRHLILSISHLMLDDVRSGLELSGIKVLGVSGTIDSLKSKFLK